MAQTLKPQVLWAQRKETLSLTIELSEAKNINVELKPEFVSFSADADKNHYEVKLDFYKPINVEESKWTNVGRGVLLLLKKSEVARWPRLTAEPLKAHWLKCDWQKWLDTEDEEEAAAGPGVGGPGGYGDMDFSSLMGGGMGGMPGMGGLGGMGGMGGLGGMGGMGGLGGMEGMDGLKDFGDMGGFDDADDDEGSDDLEELDMDEDNTEKPDAKVMDATAETAADTPVKETDVPAV